MTEPIQVVEAEGSHYDIGVTIGRQTAGRMHKLVEALPRARAGDADALAAYAAYMEFVRPYSFIVDEIRGMADGAELPFDTVARIQIAELSYALPEPDACSTLIVNDGERQLLGHNEDGPEYEDAFVLRAAYPSGLRAQALTYYGSLPGHAPWVNSHGLVTCCNALRCSDRRLGEGKRIFCRRLIECADIDEAISLLSATVRAQGENFVFAQDGRIVDVETSATAMEAREIVSNDFHCNNYLYERMLPFDANEPTSNTFVRSGEASRLCGGLRTLEDVREALSSHAKEPDCICRHGRTMASVYFDLTARQMLVSHGPPCQAEPRHSPTAWL